LELGHKFFII